MSEAMVSIEVLRKLPLCKNLNETECRQIAEICRLVACQPGDCVLKCGDESQNLWVLLEGHCDVVKPRDPNHPCGEGLKLNTLEPFAIFGEMSFFHKAPHSATVVARSPLKLLCIRRCDYDDLVRDGAWGAYKLAFNAVESLAQRLRRMSDWVAELTRPTVVAPQELVSPAPPTIEQRMSEWGTFRDRLFANWNL